MRVSLNVLEVRLAIALGRARDEYNKRMGIADQKVGNQSGAEMDKNGAGGEIAFCKLMNVYPALDVGNYAKDDCVLPDGRGVDVKTTESEGPYLLTRVTKKEKKCDLYALMVGPFGEYRYLGYIPGELFIMDENIKDLGYGPTYVVLRSVLCRELP